MLLSVIGIILLGLALWRTNVVLSLRNITARFWLRYFCWILVGSVSFIIIMSGFTSHLNGYNEPIVKEEIILIPIYVDDETGNEIYAIKSSTGEYFVKYIEDEKVVFTTVVCPVIETENIEKPVKQLLEYDAKPNLWSFAVTDLEETKLILPSGSVSE